ncbi:MAG: pentapeptide repeat-containing protein [Candidatus Methanofastidiosa archaeon]|nr:pentapeptide repeat-containing protein [Candidatus Methanofastidiosa archaeon]
MKVVLLGSFSRTELSAAVFTKASLGETNFERAWLTHSSFRNIDLSTTRGLATVTHYAPSSIGFDTIRNILTRVWLKRV